MIIYKDFLSFTISFVIFYLPLTITVSNKYLNLIENGQGEVNPSAIGITMYTIINNTSEEDFFIEILPDQCCLDNGGSSDCESLNIVGDCAQLLSKGGLERFQLIAPIISPVERRGYCSFYIDSRPTDRRNRIMRNTIKINFDTTIQNNPQLKGLKPCRNKDEDPLNNCKPVNCESYYNGQKPYYDKVKKRCAKTKVCNKSQIYDNTENECKNCEYISETDLKFIKGLIRSSRPQKDVIVIKTAFPQKEDGTDKMVTKGTGPFTGDSIDNPTANLAPRVTTAKVINDLFPFKIKKANHTKETNHTKKTNQTKCQQCEQAKAYNCFCCKMLCYIKTNMYTLIVLAVIILVQCFLLYNIVKYLRSNKCCGRKDGCQKVYNSYRQEASVTTPLIGTSNLDTESTEINYMTESSNVDNKIKCYKTCQNESSNQAKMSMSDDILTKYLNRRDWNIKLKTEETEEAETGLKSEIKTVEYTKVAEVTHENEQIKKHDPKTIEKGTEDYFESEKYGLARKGKEIENTEYYNSEREIQSHDYCTTTENKFLIDKRKKPKSKKTSISTEKGAQAYFSNDSVDDLLSEKGILYFEENISKYSFSTSSLVGESICTNRSSKTSKNNILKHFLSFLSRKSKLAVSSEPNKSKDKLELLHRHLSRKSVQSSSDSNVKDMKDNRFYRESRSTF